MYDENSPILGQSPVAADRIATFILARPAGEYTEKDIRGVIIPAYMRVCGEVGVNALLAVAQMIHETGNLTSFWAARPHRNPAGIGVNGQTRPDQPPSLVGWSFDPSMNLWRFGVSFATWEQDAIVAHIGRLLAYTLPRGSESAAQAALIAQALSYRPLPDKMRGSAPTLRQLGKAHNPTGQGWASPGTEYGAKIAALASRMAQ
jgi:Mannosyl-glycoprotein endo-beta-N-acetylglucosaminidase